MTPSSHSRGSIRISRARIERLSGSHANGEELAGGQHEVAAVRAVEARPGAPG
jgi:hypothetical protein